MMDRTYTVTWQRYFLLARYHWKFLAMCLAGGLVLGLMVNLFLIHPRYSSIGKLLIKGGKQPTFVTEQASPQDEVKALTINGNPLLTQIEVLNSPQLATRVLAYLHQQVPAKEYKALKAKYPDMFEADSLADSLTLKNPANTDIVSLRLSTHDKKLSKYIVDGYIHSYQDFLQDINHQTLMQHGQYIENQIQTVEKKLKDVRRELMAFRMANQTIDIPNEAQASIQQLADLETQRIALQSQIRSRQGMVSTMRRHLGMSAAQGIQSVALGMNNTLVDGQKALNAAQQEYSTLAVKYTDETPSVQAVKARIQEIQQQVQREAVRTLGAHGKSHRLQIADPVRGNLVNTMADAEAELQGLRAQHANLQSSIAALQAKTRAFPVKQLRIAELMEQEKVLSDMVSMLRLKAADAEFKASDNLSNVVTVQPATLARKPDFPGPKHILVLMMFISLLGGMGWLLALEWLKMQTLRPMHAHLNTSGKQNQKETTYSAE